MKLEVINPAHVEGQSWSWARINMHRYYQSTDGILGSISVSHHELHVPIGSRVNVYLSAEDFGTQADIIKNYHSNTEIKIKKGSGFYANKSSVRVVLYLPPEISACSVGDQHQEIDSTQDGDAHTVVADQDDVKIHCVLFSVPLEDSDEGESEELIPASSPINIRRFSV